jgi:hypothetical protein
MAVEELKKLTNVIIHSTMDTALAENACNNNNNNKKIRKTHYK